MLAAFCVPAAAFWEASRALWSTPASNELPSSADIRRWLVLLGNTSIVVGVAVATALALGSGAGLLAARTDLPGRRLVRAAALIGACVPIYVSSAFFLALAPRLIGFGSAAMCGVLYGLVYTPLATLTLGAAFRAVDWELEDVALLDAGPMRVIHHVTLPHSAWAFVATALLITLFVATDFTIADLLIVRTFAEECYIQYQLDRRQAGPLLTALPLVVALAVVLTAAHARYRRVGELSPAGAEQSPRTFRLGRWRTPVAWLAGISLLAAVGVPLGTLLNRARPLEGLPRVIAGLVPELRNTALLVLLGATLVLLPAGGLAWHLARGHAVRWPLIPALILLLVLPAPVVGITLTALLNRPGLLGHLYDSPLVVPLGYYVRFLPIAVLLLLPAARRVPTELVWAARVDGCDSLGIARHVSWPAMRRDTVLAWLIVAILCTGEIGTTILVVPPGWETAAVRAFTLLHFGVYRDLAVLTLLAVGIILLPAGGLLWLLRRS
jgi:iron(III) transport system permease protein